MMNSFMISLPSPILSVAESADPMKEVVPHKLGVLFHNEPGTLLYRLFGPEVPFTNHMAMAMIVAGVMLLLFPYLAARTRKNPVPTGTHNFFEAILVYLRNDVFKPALGENTDRFVPYLWTVFFFILISNILGLIPGAAIIELINHFSGLHIPLFWGAATGNVMVTAGLAVLSFLAIHFSGIFQQIRIARDPSLDPHHHAHDHGTHELTGTPQAHDHHGTAKGLPLPVATVKGFLMYWWNFAPHDPWILWIFLFPLEMIGALVKPFALCMRLFANIMAGHVVLASLVGLIFVAELHSTRGQIGIAVVIGCAALSILELFVAFLQAYIFTFLTTLFLAAAVAPEH